MVDKVDELNRTYAAATVQADASLLASVCAPDFVLIDFAFGATAGVDAVHASMVEQAARMRVDRFEISTRWAIEVGDELYAYGSYVYGYTPTREGAPRTMTGEFVEIWRRDASRQWRLTRDVTLNRHGVPRDVGPW